jgi:hypothetical protein
MVNKKACLLLILFLSGVIACVCFFLILFPSRTSDQLDNNNPLDLSSTRGETRPPISNSADSLQKKSRQFRELNRKQLREFATISDILEGRRLSLMEQSQLLERFGIQTLVSFLKSIDRELLSKSNYEELYTNIFNELTRTDIRVCIEFFGEFYPDRITSAEFSAVLKESLISEDSTLLVRIKSIIPVEKWSGYVDHLLLQQLLDSGRDISQCVELMKSIPDGNKTAARVIIDYYRINNPDIEPDSEIGDYLIKELDIRNNSLSDIEWLCRKLQNPKNL